MKKPKLKVRDYTVVEKAVESGIRYGLNRVNKHEVVLEFKEENFERLVDALTLYVMTEVSEVVLWNERGET